MSQANFLVEIHTEELPPKSLYGLANSFRDEIKSRLEKAGLSFNDPNPKTLATPRRLAVIIPELASEQSDKVIERKGPALDKAYDADGKPTQALLGFARSCGVDVAEFFTLETPQGKFVGCKQHVKGKTIVELMPQLIEETLAALPIPKPMRWGNHSQKFIRPVHSVMMLYGDKVIEGDILGCKVGRRTRGHRFHYPEWFDVISADTYEKQLEDRKVIVGFKRRREKIWEDIDKCRESFLVGKDEQLLDEVTSLVEYPQVLRGSFDKAFLKVPLEALVSAMKNHQRYFPVCSSQYKLAPYFIAVSNIESNNPARVVTGNERVLRARLSDAAFFFETDQKIGLEDRVEKLTAIIFQNKLGTLFDKTQRIRKLAIEIAKKMDGSLDEIDLVDRAALLSKTDLTTELVGEFPELQGLAGYTYAITQEPRIASALLEQYYPRFSGDPSLPKTLIGMTLAIADRLDTLVGIFGINQAPTGDKDPFGLRRAAIGVLRILVEKQLNLDLRDLLKIAVENYGNRLENKNVLEDVLSFIQERLRSNCSADIFSAVSALKITNPHDFDCRAKAVTAFKQFPEAEALSVANKRVSNILAKYEEAISAKNIDANLFETDAERHLFSALEKISLSADYLDVLKQLAHLRKPVDDFFDQVMVMTEDKPRRENRILLLKKLRELFLHVADIALLQ